MAGAIQAQPLGTHDSRTRRLRCLEAIERKVLWLACWTIHNANHLRPNRDGLKVGGHQASSASVAALMTALYFGVLRPRDRVAVKPHASPVFHAIQYLLGRQSREKLEGFRAFGGAQAYPSRTKDADDVDFSTGSVGLGAAQTCFAALVQDYLGLKGLGDPAPFGDDRPGRMVAVVGDAELDEGNIFEALYEGWKHDIRNVWWIVDFNRQSLDAVLPDHVFGHIDRLFASMGWRVLTLKYGKKLQAAFERPGGGALKEWIDACPNSLYSALVFKGGDAWRARILGDMGESSPVADLVRHYDDSALQSLMTNLGGHDIETILESLAAIPDDRPTCILAYTIKGHGLPFAGHKDNHAGLMNDAQMAAFKTMNRIPDGAEWDKFAGLDMPATEIEDFLSAIAFNRPESRRLTAPMVPVPAPARFPLPAAPRQSTQEGFGRILADIAREGGPLADRIVTTSPDVTVSTSLGGWVNRRGLFHRDARSDTFVEQKVVSAQAWTMSRRGQHIELGIAENNLFLLVAALGLSHELFGARLLPVATLYDPFIQRGLDALNHACYQDARFILAGTPSGITLAPEGGAHQSIGTPLIGIAQDGLAAFEPAFVDELAVILQWAFEYIQRDGGGEGRRGWLRDAKGGSVYLRLSTRPLDQPKRDFGAIERRNIIDGGYWLIPPAPGAGIAIVYAGAVAPDAIAAHAMLAEDVPGAGLLAVTSADRLNAGWQAAQAARQRGPQGELSTVESLLGALAPGAGLVTVVDGHPMTLSWLGAVLGHRVQALGVEHFGQSGDIPDLYRHYRIDTDAILDACAAALLRAGSRPGGFL